MPKGSPLLGPKKHDILLVHLFEGIITPVDLLVQKEHLPGICDHE